MAFLIIAVSPPIPMMMMVMMMMIPVVMMMMIVPAVVVVMMMVMVPVEGTVLSPHPSIAVPIHIDELNVGRSSSVVSLENLNRVRDRCQ